MGEIRSERRVPLLPLRGVLIFPGTIMHLDVGREKSVKALEEAKSNGHHLFLATQKETTLDDPQQEDLYKIGTFAKINQASKLSNGTVRIQVEGIQRGEITSFKDYGDVLVVDVSLFEVKREGDIESEALMRTLLSMYEQFAKQSKRASQETVNSLRETTDPELFSDTVAANLTLKLTQKQELLELIDVNKRLHKLIERLGNEQEVLGLERKIGQRVKKAMEKTQKEYYLREQMKAIQKELGDREGRTGEIAELREKIDAAGMPEHVYEKAIKELGRYEKMPANAGESSILRTYLDWLIQLPWKNETEDELDVGRAEAILNEDHYGLDKVKERVLEYLAVRQLTKSMKGPILCLAGPPGVGKTSLARSIARSLNREFVRMSLGGVRDEAEIRGHRRTYVGAMPGRLIQGMKRAGTINPVFLLDEIDKMAQDFRGDPASALLEVLDPEQNSTFSDHYLEEAYDLSKVMFVTTANNIATIPGPLLDRMEIISIPGYTELEKLEIAQSYLLPKQVSEHGLKKSTLQAKPEALKKVIRYYTREAGVRGLERQLATLCRKAAKMIVMNERKRVVLTEKMVETMLGKPRFRYGMAEVEDQVGAATGLAYTSAGGTTLAIEVSAVPGKGKLTLTGKLGDVMKESAQAAFSYIRSRSKELEIDPGFNEKTDIHIHVPEGATPKDGPSAGITMATALISALTGRKVDREVGMTGEITLRGRVLPIGGLKEKAMSAHRAGIRTIIIPKDNERDVDDIPESVRKELKIVSVSHLDEVLKVALKEETQ
ncbi:endopeptidase La [Shouchella clausii]|uniref:Lon protease n=5 Tax=Shouchella TaxID=2893057 RepID=Q5WEP1_SHOC1|nr:MULTISPECIES: endopeptidase La [Shouchella]MCM3313364.1 endopeptidase La [Psychrobacillus sp. MER TA 17]ALA54447.1 ATP-dependent protease La [Shouchella clausii]KKI87720.1 peptidase [Shouchella clausii]MBU3232443.1 endopeptidase La [Shouchella clausii]MBU3265821.1 endopeptidase La [Shouchella clausii]